MIEPRDPEEYAVELLNIKRVERVTDINDFAQSLGLKVKEVPSLSFDGALVRVPGKMRGRIAVRESIRELGQKVFTVAHEIGHFILPGHGTSECFCTTADLQSWRAHVSRLHETAANRFASELLMPTKVLYRIVNHRKATLSLAREIASEHSTSFTAAAIRCVDLTEESCAVVWSVGGKIKWVHRNGQFHYFVPVGGLDAATIASHLFIDPNPQFKEGSVRLDSWVQVEKSTSTDLWEESCSLPYYNAVLSILTAG